MSKRLTLATCGCLAQGQSPMSAGLAYSTLALSVMQSAAAAAVCGLWRNKSDGPLSLPFK